MFPGTLRSGQRCEIHPVTAKKHGIAEGDRVHLEGLLVFLHVVEAALSDDLGQLVTYGRGESPLRFLMNQAGMQLRKRISRKREIT